MVKPKNIIAGQPVSQSKRTQSKRLRKNMTREETLLWQHLRSNRLGGRHFRRQQVIHGFIVDFYCHSAALIIEVDGPVHQKRTHYDAERDRILSDSGFKVLRFRNEEIANDIDEVLGRVLGACKET